ncbi:MAG: ATP-binding cassette domain-containing protein [Patescibacteria group bacterium]|jgi:ABC-type lipoprotein export system ATPase subunit|nr:ATP-binding cassette domain-containing protein [Patescibacteria group bacterium]
MKRNPLPQHFRKYNIWTNKAVEINDVHKSYMGSMALKGISLDIDKSSITSITGHSGSGKSTLLRIIQGIEKPDKGEVTIFNQKIDYSSPSIGLKNLINQNVGIGFQSPMLMGNHSVLDNIQLYLKGKGVEPNFPTILDLLFKFGLDNKKKLDQPAASLSGGEQMKVALVRALASKPQLLLLDEPTSAIDSMGTKNVFKTLRDIVDTTGTTIVTVTHDSDLIQDYIDKEVTIESGELL